MRPKNKRKTALRRKGTQGETLVPPSACPRAGSPSQWWFRGGEPRHPKQHKTGIREATSTGSKGKGSQCPRHSLRQAQLLGWQGQHPSYQLSEHPIPISSPKEGKQALRTLVPPINIQILKWERHKHCLVQPSKNSNFSGKCMLSLICGI